MKQTEQERVENVRKEVKRKETNMLPKLLSHTAQMCKKWEVNVCL